MLSLSATFAHAFRLIPKDLWVSKICMVICLVHILIGHNLYDHVLLCHQPCLMCLVFFSASFVLT